MPTVKGVVQVFDCDGSGKDSRKYIVINTNVGSLQKICKPVYYNEETGEGDQRFTKKSWVNTLKNAVINKTYSPDTFKACVTTHNVKIQGKIAEINIPEDNPLKLLNGNHRATGLLELAGESPRQYRLINNLPATVIILLEEKKFDFIASNSSLPIDPTHLATLRITAGLMGKQQNVLEKASQIIRVLHDTPHSPVYNQVRFSANQADKKISMKGLLGMGSDQACSAFGSAKIANGVQQTPNWMADVITRAHVLIKGSPSISSLLNKGKVLSPPPQGKIGGASLLIGLGNMLAYRAVMQFRDKLTPVDEKAFIMAVQSTLDEDTKGDLSGPRKRRLLRDFAEVFFEDGLARSEVVGGHQGIPIPLVVLFGAGAFDVDPLPKSLTKQKLTKEAPPAILDENDGEQEEIQSFMEATDTVEGFE